MRAPATLPRALALLAVATAPCLAAQGEGDFSLTLRGKAFDERCLRLAAGESIRYRFRASAAVDFNIHHHRGKEVFYPVRQKEVRAADGSFRAQAEDDYCLMWEHAAAGTAEVEGSIERSPR